MDFKLFIVAVLVSRHQEDAIEISHYALAILALNETAARKVARNQIEARYPTDAGWRHSIEARFLQDMLILQWLPPE